MLVSELIEQLEKYPGDAYVYVNADHGQTSELAGSVDFTCTRFEDPPYYCDDDLCFDPDEYDDEEADMIEERATAIRILS